MMTIVLTGATDGIGLETAKRFAKEGHKLLLHGRNAVKLENVKKQLLEINEAVSIKTFVADLSELKNTKVLAEEILNAVQEIDVIINNAGVFVVEERTTEEGLDVRWAVNTISPYLLTKMLLPILSVKGRIINLSSAAQTSIDFDALRRGEALSHDNAYAQSKLAIAMWGMELAEMLGEKVVVVSVNPKSFLGSKMVKTAYGRKGYDLSIGADILYRAALSEEFSDKTGRYYDNDYEQFSRLHPFASSKENRLKLVEIMDEIMNR
ncbi:MAG: SDR family NAD(P)-dependent oxidoreductase [Eubacteriales bacterium]